MEIKNFRFHAVVDWIEVEIQTQKPTHYDAIRRFGGLSFVEPIDPAEKGKSATVFRAKIFDPSNWQVVASKIETLADKFALAEPFHIVGIEVAFDVYNRNKESISELASVAASFVKFTTHTHANRRMYRERMDGSFAPPSHLSSLERHLENGWQCGVNDKSADRYQHIYVKVTDHNAMPLLEHEHRARIEITLRGKSLPCDTNEEWSQYNFAELAKPFFSFRTLRPGLTQLEDVCAASNMQIGRRGVRNRREGGTRLFSRLTSADSSLNRLARDKLRDLSDRWQAIRKTTLMVRSERIAC